MKATSYSIPYHEAYDTPVADVEEAIRLGADAISVGCIMGGPEQAQQLSFLWANYQSSRFSWFTCRSAYLP